MNQVISRYCLTHVQRLQRRKQTECPCLYVADDVVVEGDGGQLGEACEVGGCDIVQ